MPTARRSEAYSSTSTASGRSHQTSSDAVTAIAITTPAATSGSSPTKKSQRKRTSLMRRPCAVGARRRTNANDARQTNASTPGSDASSPGQCAPAPSADQKIPNVVSITPTANFIAFSGTRASGARTATPIAGDEHDAPPRRPTAASGIDPCALPKVRTMNATSSPSRSTPLKASSEAVGVDPGALGAARPPALPRARG